MTTATATLADFPYSLSAREIKAAEQAIKAIPATSWNSPAVSAYLTTLIANGAGKASWADTSDGKRAIAMLDDSVDALGAL